MLENLDLLSKVYMDRPEMKIRIQMFTTYIYRNYMSIEVNELPDHVTKCLKFLQSDALFLILSSLTGLKLHELAEVSDSEEEEEQTNQKGRLLRFKPSL